jgi:hypothetical protein
MNVKSSSAIAGALLLATLSACASQPVSSPSAPGTEIASAPAGQKCEIDAKRICQEIRNKPVTSAETGMEEDATSREQNSDRTASEFVSFPVPNGSVVEVSCEINAAHSTVVYAHLLPGPPLTPTDVAYFQSAGYCAH